MDKRITFEWRPDYWDMEEPFELVVKIKGDVRLKYQSLIDAELSAVFVKIEKAIKGE